MPSLSGTVKAQPVSTRWNERASSHRKTERPPTVLIMQDSWVKVDTRGLDWGSCRPVEGRPFSIAPTGCESDRLLDGAYVLLLGHYRSFFGLWAGCFKRSQCHQTHRSIKLKIVVSSAFRNFLRPSKLAMTTMAPAEACTGPAPPTSNAELLSKRPGIEW